MAFPSTLSTFNRPTTSDKLNSPSHSALHNTVSSALGQVEAVIGVDGISSVVGTMMYDLRSPASNGGGHVQTANKGGTGQTSFTKGDLLIASGNSVLTKLAVGTDGYLLSANSSVATGISWIENNKPKVNISGSIITINTTGETSIMSATIPGSTLGTNNAILATVQIGHMDIGSVPATVRVSYGTSSLVTISIPSPGAAAYSVHGRIECTLIGANSRSSQLGTVRLDLARDQLGLLSTSVLGTVFFQKTVSLNINSDANQTLGATFSYDGGSGTNYLTTGGHVIEKIN